MTARVYRADVDAPECRTTHHAGCACHEARRDARERELTEALREVCEAMRDDLTSCAWCEHCGARWHDHGPRCPVGRALRVLDGSAR